MTKVIHPIAGALALLTILIFWLSTLGAELFGSAALVISVKTMIPWGFILLVPALVAAGGSGFRLGHRWHGPLVAAKCKRMPFIAGNGMLILMPSALYLSSKAQAVDFDAGFYTVQMIELVVGSVNIGLLGLNFRDGLRLTGKAHMFG